jgi:hypothetical protein
MSNKGILTEAEEELLFYLADQGYDNLRMLDDGTIVGTLDLIYTRAMYIGLSRSGFEKRFCFKNRSMADSELEKIVTGDDEPTGYIARRNG